MKVVVTGAAGQLGHAIVERFSDAHHVVPLTRRELDLRDHDAVAQVMREAAPDVIINCAAYNDVDAAERHSVLAFDVNAFAVLTLARAAQFTGAVLVHYSTDFVFDGNATEPYREEDRTNPESVYAASKLAGEWFAADAPRHYVLRVESLFGAPNGRSQVRLSSVCKIVKATVEGREVSAFIDRTISPSYVLDVADATRALIERNAPSDLYHCVNSGNCNWYELAEEAARLLGRQARLRPLTLEQANLLARRPRFCALSNAKLASHGIAMPSWQNALARYLAAVPR